MFYVIVLRSHQLHGSTLSAGVNNNLIPGRLGLKLAVTLSAFVAAVLRGIMLGNRQQESLE